MLTSKLKDKINQNGIKMEDLATNMGINRSTLYRKLNNIDKVTVGDAKRLKTFLNISNKEAIEIFLS